MILSNFINFPYFNDCCKLYKNSQTFELISTINIIMIKFLLLALALTAVLSQQVLQFDIYKTFADDPNEKEKVNLGTLEVRRNFQYNEVQTSIQPNFPVLVSQSDLERSTVILSFVPKKVKDLQHDAKVYKTAVVQRLQGSHDQIIGVVCGIDLKIKAINYLEKRSPLQEIRSEYIKMEAGKEEIAKMQMAQQTRKMGADGQPEEESFFAKYKLPIIIGIALLYLLSAADGKQGQSAPQQ